MREIADQLDLAQIQAAGRGFILNVRQVPRLHRARCDSVGGMKANEYQKIWFETETYDEVSAWTNRKCGQYMWQHCGKCVPR
jgi:hypothetical protein